LIVVSKKNAYFCSKNFTCTLDDFFPIGAQADGNEQTGKMIDRNGVK
jgi:hypothetical protein